MYYFLEDNFGNTMAFRKEGDAYAFIEKQLCENPELSRMDFSAVGELSLSELAGDDCQFEQAAVRELKAKDGS